MANSVPDLVIEFLSLMSNRTVAAVSFGLRLVTLSIGVADGDDREDNEFIETGYR